MSVSPPAAKFNYRSAEDLQDAIAALGLDIRLDDDLSPLGRPVPIGPLVAPNALAVHPMEGCDASPAGAPGELTVRRYLRYARGGAGLIWFEATALTPEVRSNPHQLYLTEANLAEHSCLVGDIRRAARETNGCEPVVLVQLTHPGRLVSSGRWPAPIIAYHYPAFDAAFGVPSDQPPISDAELETLEDNFVHAARLAWRAGYHGIDIKACHRYLLAELLAAHTRPGRYGGSFENRTRLLLNVVDKVRSAVPELLITVRLNGHDGTEYPYAWGMDRETPGQVDLEEPLRLAQLLFQRGVSLLSMSLGRRPGRAQANPGLAAAGPGPIEHPLEVIADHFTTTRAVQQAVPDMPVMGAGYSWLRHYAPMVGAANLRRGFASLVGLGRMGFAYPDFARDILQNGALNPRRSCVACGRCSQLLGEMTSVGCAVRDSALYLPIYRRHFPIR